MNSLTLLRLHVTIGLLNDAHLPPYKGSSLRGAIGHGMRALTCSTKTADCAGCGRIPDCPFTRLFKPDQMPGRSIPASYVIDPPALRETRFMRGDRLAFTLTLFGDAADCVATWINAMKVAGARFGLGENRARFEVIRVEAENPAGGTAPVPEDGACARSESLPGFSLAEAIAYFALHPARNAAVQILTPLKFKDKGSVINDLTAPLFFETLFRRLKSLSYFYAPDAPLPEYNPDFSHVTMESKSLRWVVLERKSMNHPTAINLGGFIGSFTLSNLSPELAAFLWFGQYTHLGKNTVYGCGKYRVELRS